MQASHPVEGCALSHSPAPLPHHCHVQGAVLVVLDMPVGTEFGVDYNSWNVGPRFRGVKMIPPVCNAWCT
jgi:hypothetical protein